VGGTGEALGCSLSYEHMRGTRGTTSTYLLFYDAGGVLAGWSQRGSRRETRHLACFSRGSHIDIGSPRYEYHCIVKKRLSQTDCCCLVERKPTGGGQGTLETHKTPPLFFSSSQTELELLPTPAPRIALSTPPIHTSPGSRLSLRHPLNSVLTTDNSCRTYRLAGFVASLGWMHQGQLSELEKH
jgi:hypothetical protein